MNDEALRVESLAGDLEALAGLYSRVHPDPIESFPVASPVQALHGLKDGLRRPLTRLEFYGLLAPVVNGTGDEHTHLMLPEAELRAYAGAGGLFFPYRLSFIGGRAYVAGPVGEDGRGQAGALEPSAESPARRADGPGPGSEILSIGGRPMSSIAGLLKGFFSGTCDAQRLYFLGGSFPEAMFLGYGPANYFDVEWSASPPSAAGPGPSGALCGEEWGSAPGRRRAGVVGGQAIAEAPHDTAFPILNESPLRFRADNSFRREGERAMVIDFRAFENPRGRFGALVTQAMALMRREGRDRLIVDLRRNIGGGSFVAAALLSRLASEDYLLLQSSELKASAELKAHFLAFMPAMLRLLGVQRLHPWTRELWKAEPGASVHIRFKPQRPGREADRFAGRVAFLSGPGDYSSSALLLGAVKQYGLGTIVGESSGGYPTHYGNCTRHRLPASGLEVLIPASVNRGWGLGPVEPDVAASPSPGDLATGRDAAMEAAIEALGL